METVILSVIVPVYNTESYLQECIESVLIQEEINLEVICIDDKSSDNSCEILETISKKDNRIRIVKHSENLGLSAARNSGVQCAKGKYIYFLDSDDKINGKLLKYVIKSAEEQNVDSILMDAFLINDLNLRKYDDYKVTLFGKYEANYLGQKLFLKLVENQDWICSVPRYLWKREFLIDHNLKFYENILHEDELFTFTALMENPHIIYLKVALLGRRFRANSITTGSITEKNIIAIYTVIFEIVNYCDKKNFSKEIKQGIEKHILYLWRNLEEKIDSISELGASNFFITDSTWLLAPSFKVSQLIYNVQKRNYLFTEEQISIIKEYSNIIIYGAGKYGKQVLQILDLYNIGILGFAVSKLLYKQFVFGHEIKLISDYVEHKEHALVIIAVGSELNSELKNIAEKLGFENIIAIF